MDEQMIRRSVVNRYVTDFQFPELATFLNARISRIKPTAKIHDEIRPVLQELRKVELVEGLGGENLNIGIAELVLAVLLSANKNKVHPELAEMCRVWLDGLASTTQ